MPNHLKNDDELRITNFDPKLKKDLVIIAKNDESDLTKLVKKVLRAYAESVPPDKKILRARV
jgi:hypothetical protein